MSAGTISSTADAVDQVARNLERAMQSRRQYFAAPAVSGVGHTSAATPPPVVTYTHLRDGFLHESVEARGTNPSLSSTPSNGPHSPSYFRGGAAPSPPPGHAARYAQTSPATLRGAADGSGSDCPCEEDGADASSVDLPEWDNSYGRMPLAQGTSSPVTNPSNSHMNLLRAQQQQQQQQQRQRELQQSALNAARHDREVAVQRVELLTAALDEARHQVLSKQSELEQMRARQSASEETVEQLQYECVRLQACARRDHAYQTQCALALLSTQEEYARRAFLTSEEKWRLSIAFAQQWEAEQQRRGEELDRWAQRGACAVPLDNSPTLPLAEPYSLETSSIPSPHSPFAAGARRHPDNGVPMLGRAASVPVSPRSRRATTAVNSIESHSHRHSSGRTDSDLSAVKSGLLTEVMTAKKELESDLALARESVQREQARCLTRDEEIARLRHDLLQEQQLTAELQAELEDMVRAELLLRETNERHALSTSEASRWGAMVAAFYASHATAEMDPPPRRRRTATPQVQQSDQSPSSGSQFATPTRQTVSQSVELSDEGKHTPPNRPFTPLPVSPLPSPSPLPAIRLREAQLEHYRRYVDPFDDSRMASTDASMTSMPISGAAAASGPATTNSSASPLRAPAGFTLQELRSMMDQLLKSHLMPLKVCVESLKATSENSHEHQCEQLHELTRTVGQLHTLTVHDGGAAGGGVNARSQAVVDRIASVVADCNDTLLQRLVKLQETQDDALQRVQEAQRVSKKSARILSHNDIVMDRKLKDILTCQSTMARQCLSSVLDGQTPNGHRQRPCTTSTSPSQVRSSSQGVSPEEDAEAETDSPSTGSPVTVTDATTSATSQRLAKQVSFKMPLFDPEGGDTRKGSVMEMSRSGVDGTSTSHLMAEGEELFNPHNIAFASPPSHVWDLVDSDDESVPPLPTGAGFRTPYDVDGGS